MNCFAARRPAIGKIPCPGGDLRVHNCAFLAEIGLAIAPGNPYHTKFGQAECQLKKS